MRLALFLTSDHSIFPGQESTLVRVPSFKEIPVDMTPNLQERLNGITEVLSRVSKLVTEDLEKAVSAVVGQDKQGRWSSPDNQSSDRPIYRPADILLLFYFFALI